MLVRQFYLLAVETKVFTYRFIFLFIFEAIDYIYADELDTFVKNGTIDKLFCAFSRDAEKKVYVQNLLQEQRELVWNVINKNGHIYVCG